MSISFSELEKALKTLDEALKFANQMQAQAKETEFKGPFWRHGLHFIPET